MKIPWLLLAIWSLTVASVLPTITAHVDDPNMLIYANPDEGGQMDLIWSYYSGERRPSFQWDFDYGVEMAYVADIARLVLAPLMDVTPGLLILILRWIHLAAWLAALGVFWRLLGRHVGRGWPQRAGVLLLAVRPAFAYLTNNWKPEPLVLLFLLLGLDAALRLVERPSRRLVYLATACAALAFSVKYAGLFLLPAVVASILLADGVRAGARAGRRLFPVLRMSWILYGILGCALLALTASAVLLYVRRSTGTTWYAAHGLWGSLAQHPALAGAFVVGCGLIGASGLLWFLGHSRAPAVAWVMERFERVNSAACLVAVLFAAFTLLATFQWVLHPQRFIMAYSQLVPSAISTQPMMRLAEQGLLRSFLGNLAGRIQDFDPLLFLLLAVSAVGLLDTLAARKTPAQGSATARAKRLVLLAFCAPFLLAMASMMRITLHHLLPCVAAALVLILWKCSEMASCGRGRPRAVLAAIAMALAVDFAVNAGVVARERLAAARYRDDVIYELADWWRSTVPPQAKIVADYYTNVYILPGYPHISVVPSYVMEGERVRELVRRERPEFLYYNAGSETPIPPLAELLPGEQLSLVKVFDSAGRRYQRRLGDKFLIYRVQGSG